MRQGQGKCDSKNGDVYQGEWKKNKFNGQGTRHYADGTSYSGDWKNHKRHG